MHFSILQVDIDYEPVGLDYPAYLQAPEEGADILSYPELGAEQEQEQELEQEQEQDQELDQGPVYENFLIADAIESPVIEASVAAAPAAPPLEIGRTSSPSKEPEIR
jgi:hypothetical protein